MPNSSDARYDLVKVALGEMQADLAITGGSLVNVYTGEVQEGDTVLVKGDKIAYVGKHPGPAIGPHTQMIEAQGKVVIPGLINGHTHMCHIFSTHELVKVAMRTGTTTIISETQEPAFVMGQPGIREYIRSTQNQPIKFWVTIPPMATISPVSEKNALTPSQLKTLLRRPEVVGLGEAYWGPVVAGDSRQLGLLETTRRAGKKLEGHTAGASGNKLQAYLSLGFTDDHEPIGVEDTLERLRLGTYVLIREGEVRRDLEAISRIKDRLSDFRRLGLATDGYGAWQLTAEGFMDTLVQKAIELGFSPVQAIQMATLNVAEHFDLDDIIGGVAPGRLADIVIIPNLTTIKAETVISNGKVVLKNGELTVLPRQHKYAGFTYTSLHLNRVFRAADFAVRTGKQADKVKVRVIDQVTHLVGKELIAELPVSGGEIRMDAKRDIIKVAAVERTYNGGQTFTGFLKGLGLRKGALASSYCWDCGDLIVVGADEAEMATAVNRLRELRGGVVVCAEGKILAELALPVGGILSTEPLEEIASKLTAIQKIAGELGCLSPDIRVTLSVLTSGAIPFLRICESGLFSLKQNSFVDLIVE